MNKDRIIIEKSLIPYSFDILLGDELFTIGISYNKTHDFFTASLQKDDETICVGEPIIYGSPLFRDFYQAGVTPAIDIVAWDESGENKVVTFETLGETVFLTVDNQDESGDTSGE